MIEKTYNFGQFMTMNDQQLKDAQTMPLNLTMVGAEFISEQTNAVINYAQAIRDAIEADRKNTIKRLREFGEEKTRFAADVLQNDWFFGGK